MTGQSDKPAIEYPGIWSYRLISDSGVDIDSIARSVLGNREFTMEPSRSSSAGKYQSHHLSVVVMNDEDRITIFEDISGQPEIRYVL